MSIEEMNEDLLAQYYDATLALVDDLTNPALEKKAKVLHDAVCAFSINISSTTKKTIIHKN